jgi:predicted small lipoprotein YifL
MRALLPLIALAALLAGCGTKGPLVLPKPKPGTQKPGQPTPTPPELPQDDTRLGDR